MQIICIKYLILREIMHTRDKFVLVACWGSVKKKNVSRNHKMSHCTLC